MASDLIMVTGYGSVQRYENDLALHIDKRISF